MAGVASTVEQGLRTSEVGGSSPSASSKSPSPKKRIPVTSKGISDWAKRAGITLARALEMYKAGETPRYVGAIPYRMYRSRYIQLGWWAKYNGISYAVAKELFDAGRAPKGLSLGPQLRVTNHGWYRSNKAWAEMVAAIRKELESGKYYIDLFDKRKYSWNKRTERARREIRKVQKEAWVIKQAIRRHQQKVMVLNRMVRDALDAKQRGELFLSENETLLLAERRKKLLEQQKRSLGQRRRREEETRLRKVEQENAAV